MKSTHSLSRTASALAALFMVVWTGPLTAQVITADSSTPTLSASATSAFEQQQQLLEQSLNLLLFQNATSQQLQDWMTQNSAQLKAQQQFAIQQGAAAPLSPLNYVTYVDIDVNATQEMSDFLTAQGDLYNRYVQLHNQQAAAGATSGAEAAVLSQFQQQNAGVLQDQGRRAQTLGLQSQSQPLPVPPPFVLPPGLSPQLRALLTLKDQIMRDYVTVWNQSLTSSPTDRDAARQKWHKANESRFQQIQQLAQALTSSTSN